MDYNVVKVAAATVNKPGSANNGTKYVICTIEDPDGDRQEVPVFNNEAEQYLECIGVANGGKCATGDQPIPEKKSMWHFAYFEEFVFPEPMVQVDATTGQPTTNKFGQMYTRSSVMVLTRYKYDESRALLKDANGNPLSPLQPMKGWDKQSRGSSVMNAFYKPARLYQNAAAAPDATSPAPAALPV